MTAKLTCIFGPKSMQLQLLFLAAIFMAKAYKIIWVEANSKFPASNNQNIQVSACQKFVTCQRI